MGRREAEARRAVLRDDGGVVVDQLDRAVPEEPRAAEILSVIEEEEGRVVVVLDQLLIDEAVRRGAPGEEAGGKNKCGDKGAETRCTNHDVHLRNPYAARSGVTQAAKIPQDPDSGYPPFWDIAPVWDGFQRR